MCEAVTPSSPQILPDPNERGERTQSAHAYTAHTITVRKWYGKASWDPHRYTEPTDYLATQQPVTATQ